MWLIRFLSGHPETRRDFWQDWQGRFLKWSDGCKNRAAYWRDRVYGPRR